MLSEKPLVNPDFHFQRQFHISPSESTDTNTPEVAYEQTKKKSNFTIPTEQNSTKKQKSASKKVTFPNFAKKSSLNLKFLDVDSIISKDRLYSFGVQIESEEEPVTKKIKKNKDQKNKSDKKSKSDENNENLQSSNSKNPDSQGKNPDSSTSELSSKNIIASNQKLDFDSEVLQSSHSNKQLQSDGGSNADNNQTQSGCIQNLQNSAKNTKEFIQSEKELSSENMLQGCEKNVINETIKKIEEESSTDSLTCKEMLENQSCEIELGQNTLQSNSTNNKNQEKQATLNKQKDQIKPERKQSVEDIFLLKSFSLNIIKRNVPIGNKYQTNIPDYQLLKNKTKRNIQKYKIWDCNKIDVSITKKCLDYLQMFYGSMVHEEDACQILSQCNYDEKMFKFVIDKDRKFWKNYFEQIIYKREEQQRLKMQRREQRKLAI